MRTEASEPSFAFEKFWVGFESDCASESPFTVTPPPKRKRG